MSIQNYRSGIAAIEPLVYITDRDNELREPLEHFDTVQPDWDIDRAGSKSRVEITTYRDVLEDFMWIAPYQRIIPETGDIIEQQMGHFRLERPSDVTDGNMHRDGSYKVVQEAVGADIVDDIANTNLPFTFYTPRGGNIMSDVYFLIKLASVGVITPIPIANHSFEETPLWTGWTTGFSNGAGGVFNHIPGSASITVADGRRAFGITFEAGSRPVQGYGYAWQLVAIPAGATKLMLTGLHIPYNLAYRGAMSLQFRDSDNNIIGSSIGSRIEPARAVQWYRALVVADVPDDAVTVRVYVESRIVSDGAPWARPMWDDIRLYSITSDPIPDRRINLPLSTAVATTRIQTTVGDSVGYTAINEHRLNAISHHALFTELDGRLTTAPFRSLANATVARQFGMDDFELVGEVRTERAARRPYNHFQAIKEDAAGENPTLFANAYNEDPNDRRSIHNAPLNSAPPIQAPDAVDEAALQALADAARDRESENEVLQIRILPGEALRPHDVIEITESENPRAVGRWLVEYIRPGMTPDDPLVEIGARRARSQEVS